MRENALGELEIRFFRLLGALRARFKRELAHYGLTFPQFMTLLSLERAEGPCRMGPLANAALQSLPSMTGIVDRLVERGLVERRRDPKDRRSVVVSLTDEGRQLLRKLKDERLRTVSRLLEALPAEDLERLRIILDHMLQALEAEEP